MNGLSVFAHFMKFVLKGLMFLFMQVKMAENGEGIKQLP